MNALTLTPANDAPPIKHIPCNLEAEQYVLGALLYDNAAFDRCDDLKADHFFEPFHARLFAIIESAIRRGQLAEPILVADQVARDPAFEELGGLRYLALLVEQAPPSAHARDYARAVIETAKRRELIRIAGDLEAQATDPEIDASAADLIEGAEGALYKLAENGRGQSAGVVSFADAVTGAVKMAAAAFERDGGLSGLSTGLIDLDRKLGGLHPSDLVILAARPSMGKAQGLDDKVLLRDGSWRRMGDIRLGDHLASVDGAPSRVAGIFPQGDRMVYRVTFSDGRSARACGEHLWLVRSSKLPGGESVLSTEDIRDKLTRERFRRRMSVPMVSGHFGEDRNLLIEPWLLGALIGNGCMTVSHLSLSTADAATLYRVQQAVGHDSVIPTGDAGYDYRLRDAGLRDALRHYGLYGSASGDKFIPADYLAATRESRLELLRGLIDTDGWVEEFGAVRYCTVSPRLADDVASLVRSVGGVCTISVKAPHFTHKGERREGQAAYVLNISHPERATLMSLKRKQRRCEQPMRFRAPTIISVEPEGVEPVQCIRVTHPSALYVTDDYVVTHNTALAANIAFSTARAYAYETRPDGTKRTTAGGQVLFFSLEMSAEQLAMRILAETSGVSGDRIRKGEIEAHEFGRVRDAAIEIQEAPLHIDATGGLALAKLVARARRQKRMTGLDLIVVDYLQLVTTGRKDGNRVQEVSEITMGLKALAKDLDVPVIALSQLSRQVEQREDKRPQLSDLRESGSIEQDADMVLFLYREEYYRERAEPEQNTDAHIKWCEQMDACRGKADVIIGKQRHGPIGTVTLAFNGELTKFSNLAQDGRYPARNPHGDA
jgi:replicative DNA helicase